LVGRSPPPSEGHRRDGAARDRNDDYGLKDRIIPAFADAIGTEGLDELARLIHEKLESAASATGRADRDANCLISGLTQIVNAKGDPDAFVAVIEHTAFVKRRAVEVAPSLRPVPIGSTRATPDTAVPLGSA
jgi:hypothetical protein